MQDIILLHGAIGAKDQLRPLAENLQTKGFIPHLLSFSGHGSEPFAAEFGISQFVGELHRFILEKRLEQPSVFGYSMGGYVALQLALQYPELIGKIATLATKFAWTPDGARKEAAMLDVAALREKVPQFATVLQNRHSAGWIELLEKTSGMIKSLGEKPLLGSGELNLIKNKVLLGVGDLDTMVSLDETINTFQTIPQAGLYVLPGTKHPIETVSVDLLGIILEQYFRKTA